MGCFWGIGAFNTLNSFIYPFSTNGPNPFFGVYTDYGKFLVGGSMTQIINNGASYYEDTLYQWNGGLMIYYFFIACFTLWAILVGMIMYFSCTKS